MRSTRMVVVLQRSIMFAVLIMVVNFVIQFTSSKSGTCNNYSDGTIIKFNQLSLSKIDLDQR